MSGELRTVYISMSGELRTVYKAVTSMSGELRTLYYYSSYQHEWGAENDAIELYDVLVKQCPHGLSLFDECTVNFILPIQSLDSHCHL